MKYCDEYVSVCVYLSVCLRGYLRNHMHDLCQIFLCMLPMAVAQSSSGRSTKSQGEGAILGVFFPIDNALQSIAFWTYQEAIWDDEWAWPEEQYVMWG